MKKPMFRLVPPSPFCELCETDHTPEEMAGQHHELGPVCKKCAAKKGFIKCVDCGLLFDNDLVDHNSRCFTCHLEKTLELENHDSFPYPISVLEMSTSEAFAC